MAAVAMPISMVFEGVVHDSFYLAAFIINFVSVVVMFICFNKLCKRTSYGIDMLGKILGFKRFLYTAEKKKLETLVMENPSYFFDIIPYTYVLGVSNKWINKFETISFKRPDWYESNIAYYDFVSFSEHLNSSILSANSYMTGMDTSKFTSGGRSSGSRSSGGGFPVVDSPVVDSLAVDSPVVVVVQDSLAAIHIPFLRNGIFF
jgi:hypothetical protein